MKIRILLLLAFFGIQDLVYSQDYTFYALANDRKVEKPIYLCSLDGETGKITVNEQYADVYGGNYFALSASREDLLVTSRDKTFEKGGVVQFSVEPDGRLGYVTETMKKGDLPCHVSFTPDMQYVLSACYGDDEILLYAFEDDKLSPIIDQVMKAEDARGHYISTDPSGNFVHAVFLGMDKVLNYTIEKGRYKVNEHQAYFEFPEGYGPRHMVFHPKKDFVYIVNEYHSSVTACSYDPEKGVLKEIQNISMLPERFSEWNSGAAIRMHPNGKFLYASNRGHNSIAAFKVGKDGRLTLVEQEGASVNFPRDFNLSPDGKWMVVANQKGNSIISMKIEQNTGALEYTGNTLEMSRPQAIQFFPEK